jgi:hypothetical protein
MAKKTGTKKPSKHTNERGLRNAIAERKKRMSKKPKKKSHDVSNDTLYAAKAEKLSEPNNKRTKNLLNRSDIYKATGEAQVRNRDARIKGMQQFQEVPA